MKIVLLFIALITFGCSTDCNLESTFFESGKIKTKSLFIDCNSDKGKEIVTYNETGNVIEIEKHFYNNDSSILKKHYDNGSIKSIQIKKSKLLNGEQKYYYHNGPIREVLCYKNGLKNGNSFIYDDEGKPTSQLTFQNDSLIERINF